MHDKIATVQAQLLDISIGGTRVVFGCAVTRWNDEEFEVATWGQPEHCQGSERAAETVLSLWKARRLA